MKIYIDVNTLEVCARRRMLDILPYRNYMQEQGHQLVDKPGSADQYVLFTCAFNHAQEQKTLKQIGALYTVWGDRLVVAGCLPEIYPQKTASIWTGLLLPNSSLRGVPFPAGGGKDIPVCRGCLGHCTYCVDRKAVGLLASRELSEILADLALGMASGLRSFRLVGDDLGAWGQDIGRDFYTLLEGLISMPGLPDGDDVHLHLLEINPHWLLKHEERLPAFSSPRIASLQLGIQSGSDKVLERMGREYTAEQVLRLVTRFKDYRKTVCGHFIIGFPGESPLDFEATVDFLTHASMDQGFAFLYSDMDGAPAAKYYPKVADKQARLDALQRYLQRMGYRVRSTGMDKLHFTRNR